MDPHINFTIEHERDGKHSFLDTLVTCNNGSLSTDVFCKPTNTDRYLNYSSPHDKQHKISMAQALLHRASMLPNTNVGKQQEHKHSTNALILNRYLWKSHENVF